MPVGGPVGDEVSGSFRKAKKPLTPSPLAPLTLKNFNTSF